MFYEPPATTSGFFWLGKIPGVSGFHSSQPMSGQVFARDVVPSQDLGHQGVGPVALGSLGGRFLRFKSGQQEQMNLAVCQNLVPLVNIKIAGKWMFIPLKMD